MSAKPRYRWQHHKERSVFEIVSEDGVMRPREIRYLIQQLCRILDPETQEESPLADCIIHPRTILVDAGGAVRLSNQALPLSSREAYLPPEQHQFDKAAPASIVYALGMTMLFMVTGDEKKADLDAFVSDSSLRALIARCTSFDPRMRFQSVKELSASIKRASGVVKSGAVLLLLLACTCVAAALILAFYQRGSERGAAAGRESGYRAGYASGYEKGGEDAPGIGIEGAPFDPACGNLSGNLAAEHGAIAARSADEIFFLQDGDIYRMDPYQETVQRMVTGRGARSLNYYSGWLYYCTDESVLRLNPQTLEEEVFCDSRTGRLYIADGSFYLHDRSGTGYLYRINERAGTLTQLNDITNYHCLNILGETLYFIDKEKGGSIYGCDLDGENLTLISSNSCESFCIYDGKIYAYSASYENGAINYSASALVSMDLDGANIESFRNIPVYTPNVTEGGIFYIAGNNRTIEWMSHNGRIRYTIVPTRTAAFNIAGQWIFYENEEDGGALWRVRINGADSTRVKVPTEPLHS